MTSRNTYGFLLLEPTERGKIISKLQETNTLHTLFDLTILYRLRLNSGVFFLPSSHACCGERLSARVEYIQVTERQNRKLLHLSALHLI